MKNLESELKSRDITLQTKVCLVKAMVFPVVMYGCESWTIKKAECRRTDAFELWCWRRHLRIPWMARKSNQSVPKDVNPECSLEGLMLKLQYFGHLMRKTNSLEKTLMLGRRRRGWQRMRGLDGITNSMDIEFEQTLGDIEDWRASVHGVAKSWTQLNDWTATTNFLAGYLTIEPKQQKKQAYFICFPPVGWIWGLLVGWDQVCVGFFLTSKPAFNKKNCLQKTVIYENKGLFPNCLRPKYVWVLTHCSQEKVRLFLVNILHMTIILKGNKKQVSQPLKHFWNSYLGIDLTVYNLGFPSGASGKELACHCRRFKNTGSIPGSERSPGEGHGNPLKYSCLENPMERWSLAGWPYGL